MAGTNNAEDVAPWHTRECRREEKGKGLTGDKKSSEVMKFRMPAERMAAWKCSAAVAHTGAGNSVGVGGTTIVAWWQHQQAHCRAAGSAMAR
ncbi:hypothetical protein E2562_034427 [Oryza meyeriana var. granulata]|uniref:Uncharacterized protein n=1 Tax=Oryza meyeriana var. granulata TaxID=110450 RepID=A0A6G1BQD3_9ORYZ|nr:hypothetical protein E2562_034427 [Oryza meyeriana var. granulata]